MSTSAVLMMILAMVVIWGGLVAAIVSLRRRPTPKASETRRDL